MVRSYFQRKNERTAVSRLAVLLILLLFTATGCSKLPSPKPYLATDRNTRWVNDLTYLQETLPLVHKNLFFRLSAAEFNRQLNDLKAKVPEYTDEEIEIALSIIIASVGDTHTGASIGSEFMYPLELYWFDEGIYITGAARGYEELLDAKILSLNGKEIEEVANTLRPLLAGANDSWFKTQVVYYLPIPGVLKYFGLSNGDEIELEIELASGEKKTVQLRPVSYGEYIPADPPERALPLYLRHPGENYWYEYLVEGKILYFNYRRCQQMKSKPFSAFHKELWAFIDSHEVEKLVVDLRKNRGGSSAILDQFINTLKKSSFNREGRLYVIIGKDTYSSGILNAIRLRKETVACFVGEPTGGQPNHHGEVRTFQLPNSKKTIRYSTKYFRWYNQEADTLAPDVEIKESFAAYRKGTDPVLEWIKQQH